MSIDPAIVEKCLGASTIYFAGYNDGVAEELTLKTNEITRRKSDYLEGTYAVHGIEEVMDPSDVVFVVDPIDAEIEKFQEVLIKGVGLTVVAIADREDAAADDPHAIGRRNESLRVSMCRLERAGRDRYGRGHQFGQASACPKDRQ